MRATASRRMFLKATIAAPVVLPAAVWGGADRPAPSNRITLGVIGLGPRNTSNLSHFLKQEDVQCIAVCDCFADRRARGKQLVDQHYGNADCRARLTLRRGCGAQGGCSPLDCLPGRGRVHAG